MEPWVETETRRIQGGTLRREHFPPSSRSLGGLLVRSTQCVAVRELQRRYLEAPRRAVNANHLWRGHHSRRKYKMNVC